jgi:uncharacterized protein YndB with AHSA1/START domain
VSAERWLAPLTGGIAVTVSVVLVAIYAYGESLPIGHEASVVREVRAPPEVVWALLSAPERRPEWAPGVDRIGRVDDLGGEPVWRELDASNDRFEFVVEEARYPTFRYRTAKPEDVGIDATWTWTLEPRPTGTRLTLRVEGEVENTLYRGIWALRDGPEAAIRQDLDAFAARVDGRGPPEAER